MKNIDIYTTIKLLPFLILCVVMHQKSYAQSCYGATAADMEFTPSGGTLTRVIQLPGGCTGGTWTIGESISWLTASISGTTVTANVSAYSGYQQEGTINLYRNGSIVGGIKVYQNKGNTPPPPPCIITGFSPSSVSASGESKTFTLSYSNCPSNISYTFKQLLNYTTEANLPSWVNNITQNTATRQITIHFDANTGTSERSVNIIGKRNDSGGTPNIQAIFTQPCSPKTWYADSDNDGFRDPGSTGVQDCANRGTGWTQNATIDVCPSIPNTAAENVLKDWYQDTDGDHYPDPNAQVLQRCTKPSGGWTSTPQQFTDLCPTQPYSAIGSNGCNPQCLPYSVLPSPIEFPASGGTANASITFANTGCSSGYSVEIGPIPNNSDNWLSIVRNGTQLTLTCQAGNSSKNVTVPIRINGQSQGGITVIRNYTPPPPPPCIITGFSPSTISANGENKTFTLNYQDCPSNVTYTFKQIIDYTSETDLPNWVSIVSQNTATRQIVIAFQANNETENRTVHLVGKRNDIGGTPNINAVFTQPCIGKDWYLDSDGDGLRDPGSTVVKDCATQKPGYTLSTTVDVCPNEPNTLAENILKTWYEDTDGDGFRDPQGEQRQQCKKPSGGWTENTVDDLCPNSPYSSNNGCNPNCGITIPENTVLYYEEQGGLQSFSFGLPQNCTDFELTFGNQPTWITNISRNSNTIVVDVEPTEEFREISIPVYSNGSIQGGFTVKQNNDLDPNNPPPPPPSCDLSVQVEGVIVTGTDIQYSTNAETKTVQIVFDPVGCHGEVVFGDYSNGGAPIDPDYLQIGQNQGNNTFNFATTDNNRGFSVTTYVGIYSYSTGEFLGLFRVVQSSCVDQEWYPDQDNDGSGDVTAVPRYGCTAPTDQPYTYVSNNRDLCPDVPGTAQNQGCPPGSSPENRNTITTWSYDLNTQVKASSKSYFDDLGKLEQTQSWDVKSDSIWASALLYDEFGRPTLQTLSSPIREGLTYQFKEGFIKKSDDVTDYDITDYDGTNSETPAAVGDAPETLGYYYSDNNTREPYQDVTSYPFSKTVYSELNPGKPLRNLGGNKVNGEWPQSYTFSMKASGELSQTPAFGESGYNTLETTKTVSRDVHGVENVVFMDTDGKVLAAAKSGSEGTTSPSMTVTIPEQGFVDIHIAEGITGFTVSNSSAVTVYDLITEAPIGGSTSTLGNGFYRVAVNNLDTYVPESIGVTYTVNYYDYSLNEYDEANRLVTSYQPLGATKATKLFSTYEYNTLGQLQRTTSPDEGTAEFKYREDGQIRFSQNSKQKDPNGDGNFADGEFSYTNYDEYGRPVESGVFKEGSITFTNADSLLENQLKDITVDDDGLLNGDCSEQTFTLYDEQDTAGLHAALAASNIPTTDYSEQKFLSSNVSKTFTVDTQVATTTWYSYDVYGRVDWMVQNIQNLGTKTIDYKYDPITGLVLEVDYQKDTASERFVHRYSYNSGDQLTMVETSTDGSNFETNATYSYYETGAMKRMELAVDAQGNPVQGVDYVYNLQGQLKSLNHPSLDGANDPGQDTNDLFGMQLDYYGNDYSRTQRTNITSPTYGTDQLNGNIKGIRWKNDAVPGSTNELSYAYDYDRNNWLQSADFSGDGTNGGNEPPLEATNVVENGETLLLENPTSITLKPGFHAKEGSDVIARIVAGTTGSAIADGDYDVSNITYDANGNILSLKRNKQTVSSTNAMDDLSYKYETGTNKLLQVVDADGDAANADDIDTQTDAANYVYNAIGQLIENKAEGITYTYTTTGLVSTIRRNGLSLVTFFYNDRNHRVRKDTYDGSGFNVVQSTFYVRDIEGSVMAIYDSNTLVEQPIYGSGRVAVHNRLDNSSTYELTDHLGNVRAAFGVYNGSPNTINATDYYPYGMPMPGRNLLGDYRYAFQGQEKDSETGKEAFELRLWDARIGRWLTTDPMGEYFSPYLGMGNNPILFTDPDGGCVTCDENAKIGSKYKDEAGYGWTKGKDGWTRDDGYGVTVTGDILAQFKNYIGANRYHVNNGLNSHLTAVSTRSAGLGSVTTVQIAMPQNFGSWNSTGSDGRYWVGCLSCHSDKGAYRTLAYNSIGATWGRIGAVALNMGIPGGSFSSRATATTFADDIALLSDDIIEYSLTNIPRAPKDGMLIGDKFYKGGQFIPGPRITTYYGRQIQNFSTLPVHASPLRPAVHGSFQNPTINVPAAAGLSVLAYIYYLEKTMKGNK